jgi:hypothetical protein
MNKDVESLQLKDIGINGTFMRFEVACKILATGDLVQATGKTVSSYSTQFSRQTCRQYCND